MKEITFTFENQKFTLDLEKGELTGQQGEALDFLIREIELHKWVGYCGADYYSWVGVEITDPYRDIYQFAACIFEACYFKTFPPELEPYMPEFHEPFDMEKELLKYPEEEREELREIWQSFEENTTY